MKTGLLLALVTVLSCMRAQLLPSIGLSQQPAGSAQICKEPPYLGNFYSSGYQKGDTVPDFKLYDLSGDSLVLSDALSGGKPVLLIAGSLTCPVFRAKVPAINQVKGVYGSALDVYVIYTIEAHPTDTSVYFGYVNVTSQNTSAGILFSEPKTYQQRRQMADTMASFVNLSVPVFIDGPCNEWWKHFGPAPNNSYLIDTNGIVRSKNGWFHKHPDNVFCDLDSILNMSSALCQTTPTNPGQFNVVPINTVVTGSPGELLYDYVDIVNTTTVNTTVFVKKLQQNLPSGWQSAFCADVCYGVTDDSIEVQLAPAETIHFSLDFFTGSTPDSGSVRVGFRNVNKTSNSFSLRLKASTIDETVGFKGMSPAEKFTINPNPATGKIYINCKEAECSILVYDHFGRRIADIPDARSVDVSGWQRGVYFLCLESADTRSTCRLIVTD